MAWNSADETLVGSSGQVYVASVGATLPTSTATALNEPTWEGLGYHTEDGLSISNAPELTRFGAWQSKRPIRIDRQSDTFSLTFALLQWDREAVSLAFGGGTFSDLGGGQYKYSPPDDDDGVDERALVADVVDGSDVLRIVVPKGIAVEGVDSQFARSSMSQLSVTFEALENDGGDDWYFVTNLAGFATGS
jgi:hypothetical protein